MINANVVSCEGVDFVDLCIPVKPKELCVVIKYSMVILNNCRTVTVMRNIPLL